MVIKLLYLAHDQEKGKKLHYHDGAGWYEGVL
jgi:hypothetical protein